MYISPSVVLPNVQSLSVLHSLSRVCTVVPRLPADSPALFDSRAFHCPLKYAVGRDPYVDYSGPRSGTSDPELEEQP